MKNSIIAVTLIGIIILIAVFMLRRPQARKNAEPFTEHKLGESTDNSIPHKLSTPDAHASNAQVLRQPQSQVVLDSRWLRQRHAGITIQQSSTDGEFNRGTIRSGSLTGNLGESPPRYHHQLKAGKFKLLLGENDDRHSYRRYATIVREENNTLAHDVQVSVSWTKWAAATGIGGFVFRREENDISNIGIIIPYIKGPPGSDADSARYSVEVRLQNPVRYIKPETLASLDDEPLDASRIALMCTSSEGMPMSARVLWLKVSENGSLDVMNP